MPYVVYTYPLFVVTTDISLQRIKQRMILRYAGPLSRSCLDETTLLACVLNAHHELQRERLSRPCRS
jgi:hypothetical protein